MLFRSAASSFEYRPWDYELFLCERYYQKTYPYTTVPGTSQADFDGMVGRSGMAAVTTTSGNEIFLSTLFRRKMRTTPTVKSYDRAGTVDKVTGTNYPVFLCAIPSGCPAISGRVICAPLNRPSFNSHDPMRPARNWRAQWLIIQGRLEGNALLPSCPRTVVVFLDEAQHPQPAG